MHHVSMRELEGHLYFHDLQVGARWVSPGRTVTETDVVHFAGFTGDFNPLHVDHEYARQTPFRRPIAHGLLGMSLASGLGSSSPAVHTAAFVRIIEWKFLKPIFIGDTMHVETEVASLTPSGRRRGRVVWRRALVNQAGDTVQEGLVETLVLVSPHRLAPR